VSTVPPNASISVAAGPPAQLAVGQSLLINQPGDPGAGNWWEFSSKPPAAPFFTSQKAQNWFWIQATAVGQLEVDYSHTTPSGPEDSIPMTVTITQPVPQADFQVPMTPIVAGGLMAQGSQLAFGKTLAVVPPGPPSDMNTRYQFQTDIISGSFFTSQGGPDWMVITAQGEGTVTVSMTLIDATSGVAKGKPMTMQIQTQMAAPKL